MGRRHGKKKKQQAAEGGEAAGEAQKAAYTAPADPPRAVVAVHPQGAAIAVASGCQLRVYDRRKNEHKVLISAPQQQEEKGQEENKQQQGNAAAGASSAPLLRGVAFDATGRYLLAGSEDKAAGLRLWDCSSWDLLQSIKVPKKVTAVAFTPDGNHMLAADKFGDVLAATSERPAGLAADQQQEPEILLGHYCAILTALALSSGGRLVATTDRDQRVRVSIMPADPMAGAHEIQSYCFGHTAFVTCSAFIQRQAGAAQAGAAQAGAAQAAAAGQELLVTGGGDGTLRLWDPLSGELLHTLELPRAVLQGGAVAADSQQQEQEAAAGQGGSDDAGSSSSDEEAEAAEGGAEGGKEAAAVPGADGGEGGEAAACGGGSGGGATAPSDAAVPLALAASPDGCWLVAAVDGRDELCLVQLDWEARQLSEAGWFAVPGLHLPACLAFDASRRLWAAGGPVADDSTAAFLACGSITDTGELAAAPLPDWLPAEAVQQLEGKRGDEAEQLAAAAQRRRLASQLLQKRKYSLQQLEHRKALAAVLNDPACRAAAAAGQGGGSGGGGGGGRSWGAATVEHRNDCKILM